MQNDGVGAGCEGAVDDCVEGWAVLVGVQGYVLHIEVVDRVGLVVGVCGFGGGDVRIRKDGGVRVGWGRCRGQVTACAGARFLRAVI